jgi:hypothetical protein
MPCSDDTSGTASSRNADFTLRLPRTSAEVLCVKTLLGETLPVYQSV